MKKFISKLVLFVLLVSAVVGVINVAYMKMDISDKDDAKKFASIPEHIQICNFGASHGLYGFNYADFEDKYSCFNFGLSSQTLSYDFRLLKHYQEHIGKGTIVFIPVSYFSLFGKSEVEGKDFFAKNKRYYRILPREAIKEYDIWMDLGMNYVPALLVNPMDVVKTLVGKSSNSHDWTWRKKATEVDVVKDAEKACIRHLVTDKFDDQGNRIMNKEEIEALYNVIGICRERGAIPVLITVPYLEEYLSEVQSDETFFDDFHATMDEIVRNTGVEYYDFAFDARFIHNYDWFMNSDHLNKEGARAFVDILMDEVVFPKGYMIR
ncbi:MAG: hypothetical protein IJ812_03395 [Schwartzia sp.]|nr:hypothetical protein [Schwartzia sp. (in: firmicutes)]MBR1759871.1 hypothetical protein [Schwartzia sp. (in: firmicutes)]MBR1885432.1 hypothetical protein [Schwartzia sp. (in: firmicutes)]